MQITREQPNPTTVMLTIIADQSLIDEAKQVVLKRLSKRMKLSGFRPGKAPLQLVERNADSSTLQSEFLDEALNRLYSASIDQEKLRPVNQPKVTLQKFVPFTELAVAFEIEVVGAVTIPDYKKFRLAKKEATVTDADIDGVIENLRLRMADKKEVERAARQNDELVIDFEGVDATTKEPVKGADGKGYPLVLGSDTFIPGFEANLEGMKAGTEKVFELAFPKDYGVKALQNRRVAFTVKVSKVHEVVKPSVNDEFAGKVGPFKTLEDLKKDIRTQLKNEKQQEVTRTFETELLEMLASKTTVSVPESLVGEEVQRSERQIRQNLAYRGQTWNEFLAEMGMTEEAYRNTLSEPAEKRVRTGLALSEIAEKENITVSPEELRMRLQLLKGQYQDKQMQAELEKPETARQIISDMLTEKTLALLTRYATAPKSV